MLGPADHAWGGSIGSPFPFVRHRPPTIADLRAEARPGREPALYELNVYENGGTISAWLCQVSELDAAHSNGDTNAANCFHCESHCSPVNSSAPRQNSGANNPAGHGCSGDIHRRDRAICREILGAAAEQIPPRKDSEMSRNAATKAACKTF